jgi:hypothetical protein
MKIKPITVKDVLLIASAFSIMYWVSYSSPALIEAVTSNSVAKAYVQAGWHLGEMLWGLLDWSLRDWFCGSWCSFLDPIYAARMYLGQQLGLKEVFCSTVETPELIETVCYNATDSPELMVRSLYRTVLASTIVWPLVAVHGITTVVFG